MLFMVIERFRDNDSWVEPNFSRCFQLMECDDLRLFQEWVLQWRGLGAMIEIVPVVPSKATQEVVALTWTRHDERGHDDLADRRFSCLPAIEDGANDCAHTPPTGPPPLGSATPSAASARIAWGAAPDHAVERCARLRPRYTRRAPLHRTVPGDPPAGHSRSRPRDGRQPLHTPLRRRRRASRCARHRARQSARDHHR